MTPDEVAYDICNRIDAPGLGDDFIRACANAIRAVVLEERKACIHDIEKLMNLDCSGRKYQAWDMAINKLNARPQP